MTTAFPGITNYIFSETAARGMYQRWADLLSSESWQEVLDKNRRLPAGGDEMSAQVSLELHHRISQFLFHEASLLDDWKFRDWLAQLDEEIRYTMRTTVNAQTRDRRKGVQPPTTWIFNDTKDQLERRIARLETGMAPRAEEPPSRTRHFNQQLPDKRNRHPKRICCAGKLSALSGTKKSAMKHSMLERVSTKFAVWKMTTGACWNGISSAIKR